MHNPHPEPIDSLQPGPAPPDGRLLGDCWFVEIMPPTWAWAYRRLMELGSADQRRFTNRMA